jgi:sodium/potassium-transporting ATPase subunit alpha
MMSPICRSRGAERGGHAPRSPAAAELAHLPPAKRLAALSSGPGGLPDAEAVRRLALYGPNAPVRPDQRRAGRAFLANFTHTLALLLWLAAGLAFAARIYELGTAIIAVIAVNGVFAFVQEYRAEQVVSRLMLHVAVQVAAVRAGVERRLRATDLVPGDVIRLAAGDIAPADCVLLASDNLSIDLSMITGETLPVERSAVVTEAGASSHLLDLSCVVAAGSAVLTGTGEAVVWSTGPESTLGQVAALVEGVQRSRSLLERQVTELSRLTAVIAVLAGALTLALTALSGGVAFGTALTFATGVIVALVPEGLLPTLSVALAIGAGRMATRGAAVRRLSAVETIGSVTVICTDKTGTLTQNALTVLGYVDARGRADVPNDALLASGLCNDAHFADSGFHGDPLDMALARWVVHMGHDLAALRERHPRRADVPFDAHRRYMAVTCEVEGRPVDFVKGAPEAVLALAGLDAPPPLIAVAMETAMHRGERVLLLAVGPSGAPPRLLGLVCFHDPPRPEVAAAIAACRSAGIRVAMLTGDHPATARALAAAIGLGGEIPVVEGRTVDGLSDAALLDRLRTDAIFARVDPGQKLRLVTLLRRSGEVVVVTGDGINDAPALRAADVGVAMGRRGTEVAKQAADIVLADDNFATIVSAIEAGRSIKANIRRFISYVLTSNVAEVAPFLVYIFLPVPLPLAVIQALAVDVGTDLLPALALGTEPASLLTMRADPEPPQRPLLTRRLALTTFLFFGLVEAALGLAAYFGYHAAHGWQPFNSMAPYAAPEREAATMTFLGIVAGQIGCLFAQRDGSLKDRLSLRANPWVAWGLAFELVLALALVYLPGLNGLFSMTAVPPGWLLVLPVGAALFLLLDLARRQFTGENGLGTDGNLRSQIEQDRRRL